MIYNECWCWQTRGRRFWSWFWSRPKQYLTNNFCFPILDKEPFGTRSNISTEMFYHKIISWFLFYEIYSCVVSTAYAWHLHKCIVTSDMKRMQPRIYFCPSLSLPRSPIETEGFTSPNKSKEFETQMQQNMGYNNKIREFAMLICATNNCSTLRLIGATCKMYFARLPQKYPDKVLARKTLLKNYAIEGKIYNAHIYFWPSIGFELKRPDAFLRHRVCTRSLFFRLCVLARSLCALCVACVVDFEMASITIDDFEPGSSGDEQVASFLFLAGLSWGWGKLAFVWWKVGTTWPPTTWWWASHFPGENPPLQHHCWPLSLSTVRIIYGSWPGN